MTAIHFTPIAEQELDNLWEQDENAAADIETALEEISSNPLIFNHLSDKKYRHIGKPGQADFESQAFEALYRKGLNLFRLKFWDVNGAVINYRVIYAHHPQADCFYILAVVNRDFNYDITHPIVQRVRRDYDSLGIPTY